MRHAGSVGAGAALAGGGYLGRRAPPPGSATASPPQPRELPLWLRDDDAKIMAAEGFYYLLFDTSHSPFREKLTGAHR